MEKKNKLIAEFMDLRSTGLSIYKPSEYKYHTSWDWLMPVISKCFEVRGSHYIESIYHSLDTQDLSFAHESVVNFIKEYNDGKDK